MVDTFYDYYQSVLSANPKLTDGGDYLRRPSVVAHSFGSYIIGYGMLKHPDMKFDKVVFCGCILPTDFDWPLLISRDQVNYIRNEYGKRDFWARIVRWFVPRAGDSGFRGFDLVSSVLEQQRFDDFIHSDFFHDRHIRAHWIPFLNRPPFSLTVIHGRDVNSREQFDRFRLDSRNIDEQCYGHLRYYDDARIPCELPPQWIKVNPDIYTFLQDRNDGSVKGYINAPPVTDGKFAQIISGKRGDCHLQPIELTPFIPSSSCKLYLMSIAIASDARQAKHGIYDDALLRLIYGFIDKLLWYALERQIVVSEIVAVVWTPEGEHLCRLIGMKELRKDEYGHPVYWSRLDASHSKRLFPGLEKLIRLYERIRRRPHQIE